MGWSRGEKGAGEMPSRDKGSFGAVYSGRVWRQEAIGWDAMNSASPSLFSFSYTDAQNQGPTHCPSPRMACVWMNK